LIFTFSKISKIQKFKNLKFLEVPGSSWKFLELLLHISKCPKKP